MKKIMQLFLPFWILFILTEITSAQNSGSSPGSMVTLNTIGIKVKQLPGWTTEPGEGYTYYRSPNRKINMLIIADKKNTMQYYSQILPSGVDMGGGEMIYSKGEIQSINLSSVQVAILYVAAGNSARGWLGMKQTNQHGMVAFLVFAEVQSQLPEGRAKMLEVMASCIEISNSEQAAAKRNQDVSFGHYSSPLLQKWHQRLVHSRLTYFDTYNSGNSGDGMRSKRTIDLCRDGSFARNSESNISIDGASNGSDKSNYGRWSLRLQNNKPLLVLTSQRGTVWEYWLSYNENKELYLDNDRYFLINDRSENGPHCGN